MDDENDEKPEVGNILTQATWPHNLLVDIEKPQKTGPRQQTNELFT